MGMSEREIIKIAVTSEAKAAIEAVGERYGMSQIELASRLYTWLAGQDEVVQAAVLGILPEAVAPDVARLVLERLAGGGSAGGAGSGGSSAAPMRIAAKKAGKPVHVTKAVRRE
jgi:hypothetical protein